MKTTTQSGKRCLCVGAALLGLTMPAVANSVADPLETAAVATARAASTMFNGLARAGSRLVAVGQRGHIVYSDDAGGAWRQATVPVSSDLVAVHFATAKKGWAAGHDGVVLATADGGGTWVRQLDGRAAGQLMMVRYADAGSPLKEEARRFAEQGADKPFLDVWFEDERTGYVVGAYNLIFRTEDGGQNWQPWFDRTDNPKQLHLYAVRRIGQELFVVGEQGLVMRLDRKASRFVALPTPYKGTFFGIAGKPGVLIAYGLRGNVFRSTDGGAKWSQVETGLQVAITAGDVAEDGRILLVSTAGHVLVSADDGASFQRLKQDRALPAFAVLAEGKRAVVLAGLRGLRVMATNQSD